MKGIYDGQTFWSMHTLLFICRVCERQDWDNQSTPIGDTWSYNVDIIVICAWLELSSQRHSLSGKKLIPILTPISKFIFSSIKLCTNATLMNTNKSQVIIRQLHVDTYVDLWYCWPIQIPIRRSWNPSFQQIQTLTVHVSMTEY